MSYPENVYMAAQIIKCTDINASSIDIARALYAEDLLMPDLPKPDPGAVREGALLKNVSRLTVVGDDGRVLEVWDISDLKAALQDDERTLKIFYKKGSLHD